MQVNKRTILLFLILTLVSCFEAIPEKQNYLGVYRIIKVIDDDEVIKTQTLNQIELTENMYISRIDRNGDNQFSIDEVKKDAYLFGLDGNNEPYIQIMGNDTTMSLHPDRYYDLLLRQTGASSRVTTLYMKKVR